MFAWLTLHQLRILHICWFKPNKILLKVQIVMNIQKKIIIYTYSILKALGHPFLLPPNCTYSILSYVKSQQNIETMNFDHIQIQLDETSILQKYINGLFLEDFMIYLFNARPLCEFLIVIVKSIPFRLYSLNHNYFLLAYYVPPPPPPPL